MTAATAVAVLGGIILIAAAIAALPTIWRFVVGVCRAPLMLQAVADEFSPNGGGSLRDAIDRTEKNVERLSSTFAAHVVRDDKFEEYVHTRMHELVGELFVLKTLSELHHPTKPNTAA